MSNIDMVFAAIADNDPREIVCSIASVSWLARTHWACAPGSEYALDYDFDVDALESRWSMDSASSYGLPGFMLFRAGLTVSMMRWIDDWLSRESTSQVAISHREIPRHGRTGTEQKGN